MKKKSTFVGSFGNGLAVGAASAAAISLAHDVLTAIEEEKDEERRRNPKTNQDTIVIHIPNKRLREELSKYSSARDEFDVSDSKNSHTIPITKGTDRDTKGRFIPKWTNKQAQDSTIGAIASSKTFQGALATLASLGVLSHMPSTQKEMQDFAGKTVGRTKDILGGISGLTLGYMGLRKLHQYIEKKRLEREVAEAQKEYIEQITKHSSYDILSGLVEQEKTAENYTGETYYPGGGIVTGPVKSLIGGISERFVNPGNARPASGPVDEVFKAVGSSLDPTIAQGVDNSSWVTGGAAASTIILALALAHVTKKYMDNKYGVKKDNEKVPRKTRIVFKTDNDTNEKKGSAQNKENEISPATAIVALFCIKDAIKHGDLDSDDVKKAREEGVKQAQDRANTGVAATMSGVTDSNGYLMTRKQIAEANGLDWNAVKDLPPTAFKPLLTKMRNQQYANSDVATALADEDAFRGALDYTMSGGKNYKGIPKKYRSTFQDQLKGVDPGSEQMRRYLGGAMARNPNLINILNEEKYRGFVNNAADAAINNYFSPTNSGFGGAISSGWLSPVGSFLRQIASWLFKNTSMGREWGMKMMMSPYVNNYNAVAAKARGLKTNPQAVAQTTQQQQPKPATPAAPSKPPAPSAPKPPVQPMEVQASAGSTKSAQFEIPNFLASSRINSDKTNEELEAKIDAILNRLPDKKKKKSKRKYVSIRGADRGAREYLANKRDKILSLVEDVIDKQEQE